MICSCQWQHDLWPYSAFEESVTLTYADGGTEIPSGTAKDYTAKNSFSFTPKLTRNSDGKELEASGWNFICEAGASFDSDIKFTTDGSINGSILKFREDSFTVKIKAVPGEGTKPDRPEMKYVPCCWYVKLKIDPINLTLTYDKNTAVTNTIKYRKGIAMPVTQGEIKEPTVSPDSGNPEDLSFSITYIPKGIEFDQSTGGITGTGSEAGTWNSTVTAQNDYYKGTVDITIILTDEEITRNVTDATALTDAVNYVSWEGGGTVYVEYPLNISTDNMPENIPGGVNIELHDGCSLTGSVSEENQKKITALISTIEGIEIFSDMVNAGLNCINGKLENCIDLTNHNITPIGSENHPYWGHFNGNNNTIKAVLSSDESYIGIFGFTAGTIEKLITAGTVTGTSFAAGITGKNLGTIKNCINTASITGNNHVGGIAGTNDNNAVIVNCCNKGSITSSDYTAYAGGIAGNNWGSENEAAQPAIQNCYNSGMINGKNYTGGITGGNENGGSVYNCYNSGTIEGKETPKGQIAGFSGKDSRYTDSAKSCISFCYVKNGENITGSEDSNFSITKNCEKYDSQYKIAGDHLVNILNGKATDKSFSQWKTGTDHAPVFEWE